MKIIVSSARYDICGGVLTLLCALAEVPAAKPYAQIVAEVMGFLVSDVGQNGIRTNDNDPEGYPVPPYFYGYAINDENDLDGNLGGYPFYLSVSYPGYTAAVGIDAFLDWRRWCGDVQVVPLIRCLGGPMPDPQVTFLSKWFMLNMIIGARHIPGDLPRLGF